MRNGGRWVQLMVTPQEDQLVIFAPLVSLERMESNFRTNSRSSSFKVCLESLTINHNSKLTNKINYMRVATDIGGTFTDLVCLKLDKETGKPIGVEVAKTDTTPFKFEEGIMNAIEKSDIDLKDVNFFAHGTTVVINALTERKGAKTALVTTKGFRDVLEIARCNRPDLFNFNFVKQPPFVPRYLRFEVEERINYK